MIDTYSDYLIVMKKKSGCLSNVKLFCFCIIDFKEFLINKENGFQFF